MIINEDFEIKKYDFNYSLFDEFQQNHYAKNLWPVVYILSDGATKEAYVGETTDTFSRISNHLRNNKKNKLTAIHLISSNKFNKSATLDIESNLIKYISGDGEYKLMNGNIGLANHNYYQKQEITGIFSLKYGIDLGHRVLLNTLLNTLIILTYLNTHHTKVLLKIK